MASDFEYERQHDDCPSVDGEDGAGTVYIHATVSVTGRDRPATRIDPAEYAEIEVLWDEREQVCPACGEVVPITAKEIEEAYLDANQYDGEWDGPDTEQERD